MNENTARRLHRDGHPLPDALIRPHPDRLPDHDVEEILHAHRTAVAEGADGYVDPRSGLFCFTAVHHWAKGRCCELGCRHCPWLDADQRLVSAPANPRPGGHHDEFGNGPRHV